MNNYPYPVLTPDESSYSEDIVFDVEFENYSIEEGFVTCTIKYNLASNYINSIIDNGNAEMYVNVESNMYSKTSLLNDNSCSIPLEKLNDIDKIRVTLYVLAKEGLELNSNDEWDDIYDDNYRIKLKSKDIIAVSNTTELDYLLKGNDFIKFTTVKEQEGKGIKVNCNGDNFILIQVGDSFNKAYAKVKSNEFLRDTLNAHILFEAFCSILIKIVQDNEYYSERTWYEVVEQILSSIDVEIEDLIMKAKDGDKIDVDYIFSVAQDIINNEIERSIIRISQKEK